MSDANLHLKWADKFPFDENTPSKDWAHRAARGVISDLKSRSGIDSAFDQIDDETRIEIVQSLSEIIRQAHLQSIALQQELQQNDNQQSASDARNVEP